MKPSSLLKIIWRSVVTFCVLCWPVAFAAAILVNQSTSSEHKTISSALAVAGDGDLIDVAPGVYDEQISIRTDGITIRGAGPHLTIIRAEGDAIRIGDGASAISTKLEALGISSSEGRGIKIEDFAGLEMRNCVVANCGQEGIHYNSTAKGNVNSLPVHLRNCTFARNRGYAIYHGVWVVASISIFDCIFSENAWGQSDAQAQSYFWRAGGPNDLIYGNVLNFGKPLHAGANYTVTAPSVLITSDPQFVAQTNGLFFLRPTSKAVNAGAYGLGSGDPDGSPTDLGAYGGRGAARFWPYPLNGPFVRNHQLDKPSVHQGATLKIRAVAAVR